MLTGRRKSDRMSLRVRGAIPDPFNREVTTPGLHKQHDKRRIYPKSKYPLYVVGGVVRYRFGLGINPSLF